MRYTLLAFGAAAFTTLSLLMGPSSPPRVAEQVEKNAQDEQDGKRRGLVAVYEDREHSVRLIARTPHFALRASESLHEQIEASFRARWTGYLRVEETGMYRFAAPGAELVIAGKEALAGALRLAAGDHRFEAKFTRKPGPVRFQIRWESEQFVDGPIPSSALFHDAKAASADPAIRGHAAIEAGRFLFEDLACASCHEAGAWRTKGRAPIDLSTIGRRVSREWLLGWLADPHSWRPGTAMPALLSDARERADVAAFLMGSQADRNAQVPASDPARLAEGRELYESIGCNKCHSPKAQSLERIGDKFVHPDELARYLLDPLAVDSSGRMPRLFDPVTQADQAQLVAEYLFYEKRSRKSGDARATAPEPAGNAERGRKLFASRGCAACHEFGSSSPKNSLAAAAFAQPRPPRLLQHWTFDEGLGNAAGPGQGRVVGTASFDAPAPALGVGKSLRFDGKTHVVLPHVERPRDMTISAWIKIDQKGGAVLAWGKDKQRDRDGTREFVVGERKRAVLYGEFETDRGWKHVTRRMRRPITDGKWHHVAVVRRYAGAQLYVDGAALGKSGGVQRAATGYSDRLTIGALLRGNRVLKRFKGWIDDVSLWATALDSARIRDLAAGMRPQSLSRGKRVEIGDWSSERGCLADSPGAAAARYELSAEQRAGLRAYLESMRTRAPRAVAPIRYLRRRVRQLNCTACHELDEINRDDEAPFVDGEPVERPPPLTYAGQKLTTAWLQRVLVEGERLWPWMKLRMPEFGDAVSDLPELFAAHAGVPDEDPAPTPPIEAGRKGIPLIGASRGQASCLVCHNYRGINRRWDSAVPAPDLAAGKGSLRWDWFRRWMANPSLIRPGTSMPQYWTTLSAEEREANIVSIWAALVHQDKLPLPPGLITKRTEGNRIVVGDDPVIFRASTNVPKLGRIDRAINVGLPGGVHYCFDATTSRLVHVWKGQFIDASPAWNGRGGKPVSAKGETLWTAAKGFPVRLAAGYRPHVKPRFGGYRLEKKQPVFVYDFDGAKVEQRIEVDAERLVIEYRSRQALLYVGQRATSEESNKSPATGFVTRVVFDLAKEGK